MKNNLPSEAGIYRVLHVESNRSYVGCSNNMAMRQKGHESDARGLRKTNRFIKELHRHGKNAFYWEVLEKCPVERLIEREKHFISHFRSAGEHGLNTVEDPAIVIYNRKVSPATIERIRVAATRAMTPELRAHLRSLYVGKNMPEETKRLISAAHVGKKKTPEHIAKVIAANKGRKRGEQAINNMRKGWIARKEKYGQKGQP